MLRYLVHARTWDISTARQRFCSSPPHFSWLRSLNIFIFIPVVFPRCLSIGPVLPYVSSCNPLMVYASYCLVSVIGMCQGHSVLGQNRPMSPSEQVCFGALIPMGVSNHSDSEDSTSTGIIACRALIYLTVARFLSCFLCHTWIFFF